MKIFYIDIDSFKKIHDKSFLNEYVDIDVKTEKRFFEYSLGRYLVKTIASEVYNCKNTEIFIDSCGKPKFKNEKLHFNISHSNNYVIACFDNSPCGIDIEFCKNRDLNKLSKHFKMKFESLEDFYKFWTLKEAKYKNNNKAENIYFTRFKEDYYITVVSNSNIESPEIKELLNNQ